MIQIKEAVVTGINTLRFGDVSIKLRVKREDVDRLALEELWDNGTSVAVVLEQYGEPTGYDKEIMSLRQQLATFMQLYSDKGGGNIEELKEKLYSRYNITSRKELSKEDLSREVDSFREGVIRDF